MSLYLYGVIEDTQSLDFGPIGFGGGLVRAIPRGRLAAVVGQTPIGGDLTKAPRETLVRLLLAHQQTLETIMKRFFVLPFRFGTTLEDEPAIVRILEEGESFLSDLLRRLKGCSEIDVIATWEVSLILQDISEEDPEIVAIKMEVAKKSQARSAAEGGDPSASSGRGASPYNVGMLLAKALQARAAKWRGEILERLKPHAEDSAGHDLLNDEMVVNRSFLLSRDKVKPFFDAVDEADLHFKKKLYFKCVGPLPPYSFATITVRRFDPLEVQDAARLLRLERRAEVSEIKKVYKDLSRACHPDLNPGASPVEFEKLGRAYELLTDYCAEEPRSLESQAIAKTLKLSVSRSPEARL